MEVIAKVVREDDIAQGEGTGQDVRGGKPGSRGARSEAGQRDPGKSGA